MAKIDRQEYSKELGKLIQKYRVEQNLSKVQLALEVGISEINIRRIENGEVNISVYTLVRLSRALNLNPCKLLPLENSLSRN